MKKTRFALFAVLMAAIMALAFTVPADAAYKTPFFAKRHPGGGVVIADQSQTTGQYWFVDSGHTNTSDSAGYGQNPDAPFATVDYAINSATAAQGDTIIVMAGHAETIAAADGFDADLAGIRIIGLGDGANQPTFTFTATGSTIAVGAANVVFENLRFVAGVHAIVIGIAVEAGGDNFTMRNCTFPEPGTNTYDFIDAIDLASGADGVKIIGSTYFHADAVGPAHFIEAGNGVNNNLQIIDNHVVSEFSVSAIWSDTIDLEVLIEGGHYENLTDGQHAIEFTTTALGVIKNVTVATDAVANSVDPGSLDYSNLTFCQNDSPDTECLALNGTDQIDLDAIIAEMAKVPKSDSTVSWNATALTAIEGEVQDGLQAEQVDHIAGVTTTVAADADLTTYIADGSALSHIMTAGANTSDYLASTMSLEAIGGLVALAAQEAEVQDALQAEQVDHIAGVDTTVAADGDLTTYVVDGSALSHVMTAGADTSDFQASTDSLEAIANAIISLDAQLNVAEATGDADIDISEAVYTGYINMLTVTAPAGGLIDCRIDIDFNKVTNGWDNIATAADVLDVVLVVQVDGTNYRSTQLASAQIVANGNGTLDASESGVSFHVGPMGPNASVQVHVKMDTERDDSEQPYRVTYVGAAPTITAVAIP